MTLNTYHTPDDWSASHFAEPGMSAEDAAAWEIERAAYAAARIVGSETTTGRPAHWSTIAPDLYGPTSTESRITRNKRRTSYVAGQSIPWNRTTGDDGMVDPVTDSVLRLVTGTDEEIAYGMTNERMLVRAADAILASYAETDDAWDDEHALGGYKLTDRPYERSATRRAMLPTFVGPHSGDRSMIGATSIDDDDWCRDHESAVGDCGCVKPRHATLGACTRHVYELAGLADAYGHATEHDGATDIRDANRDRIGIRAPSRSVAYDAVDVLHKSENGRKVRGNREPSVTVIYDAGTHRVDGRGRSLPDVDPTATVHDDGAVTQLLSFVESVETGGAVQSRWIRLPDDERGERWAHAVDLERGSVKHVPMLGHERLTIERRKRDRNAGRSTRSARDAARAAVRSLTERRSALASELTAMLASLPVSKALTITMLSTGVGAPIGRTRADRYVVGPWSAGSAAAVAVKASRLLVTS